MLIIHNDMPQNDHKGPIKSEINPISALRVITTMIRKSQ